MPFRFDPITASLEWSNATGGGASTPASPIIYSVDGETSSPASGTNATPDVIINNILIDDLVTLYVDDVENTSDTATSGSITLTADTLSAAAHEITATVTRDGKESAPSDTFDYTVTTGPTNINDSVTFTKVGSGFGQTVSVLYDGNYYYHTDIDTYYTAWTNVSGGGKYLDIDCGSALNIQSFGIQYCTGTSSSTFGKDCDIYYSDNGTNYTLIDTYQTPNYIDPQAVPVLSCDIGGLTHRYFRIIWTSAWHGDGHAVVSEVEVWANL